jgi:acid stress-induced BolA-like protein IbaG/YrbA
MITPDILKTMLDTAFPGAHIEVHSPDNVHFNAIVKAPQFAGLTRVAQQQKVYAALGDLIQNGTVHALSLQTSAL